MNKNLDLVEILKDCPKGTPLYSTVYGDVYFECIDLSYPYHYPVAVKSSGGTKVKMTSDGLYYSYYNGECTLFPSKDQRDWSKWHRPFEDGDIIFSQVEDKWISIFKEYSNEKCETYTDININGYFFFDDVKPLCSISEIKEQRFATEEEKKLLFDVLKKNGYKWNAETKTLEKLLVPKFKVGDVIQDKEGYKVKITEVNVEDEVYGYESLIAKGIGGIAFSEQNDWKLVPNKFDINTLKPFDKVLGRYNKFDTWKALYFSHISKNDKQQFYYCGTGLFIYCIPYNDDTEHLVGTDKEAPEYYRYWED